VKSTYITVEAKLHDENSLYTKLAELGKLYGFLERALFNELANAKVIDKVLRNRLQSGYIAKYNIHMRLFNTLWHGINGKLASLKELDKQNKVDLKRKIVKYEKKIKTAKKYLDRGCARKKKELFKPQARHQLKKNLHQFHNVLSNLKHKLEKPFKPSLTFGTKAFYKKQWTDDKYQSNHWAWHNDWVVVVKGILHFWAVRLTLEAINFVNIFLTTIDSELLCHIAWRADIWKYRSIFILTLARLNKTITRIFIKQSKTNKHCPTSFCNAKMVVGMFRQAFN